MEEANNTRFYLNVTNSSNVTCLEFSAEEQKTLNTTVISVSSVASLACILAITFILVSRGYRKFVHRLILALSDGCHSPRGTCVNSSSSACALHW